MNRLPKELIEFQDILCMGSGNGIVKFTLNSSPKTNYAETQCF